MLLFQNNHRINKDYSVKMILGILVISILMLSESYANSVRTINSLCLIKNHTVSKFLLISKSGCCSWHDGVCGCQNYRVICCDGSFSPTCGC